MTGFEFLDQLRKHDPRGQVVAEVGKVDIETPGEFHVIETYAANDGNQGQSAIAGLPDQLCRSVFHGVSRILS